MILYLIYVEPLLIKLAEVLKGFQLANFKEIDNDYCDDVEIVIEEDFGLVVAIGHLHLQVVSHIPFIFKIGLHDLELIDWEALALELLLQLREHRGF